MTTDEKTGHAWTATSTYGVKCRWCDAHWGQADGEESCPDPRAWLGPEAPSGQRPKLYVLWRSAIFKDDNGVIGVFTTLAKARSCVPETVKECDPTAPEYPDRWYGRDINRDVYAVEHFAIDTDYR